jgi:hypothetical protein
MSRHGTAGKKRTGSIRPRGRPNEGRRVLSRLQGHESRPMRASSSPIFRHVPSHHQPLEIERCPSACRVTSRLWDTGQPAHTENNYQQLFGDRKMSISMHTEQPPRDLLTPT